MNNLEVGTIVELDDQKTYTVFHVVIDGEEQCLFLATVNEPLEIIFAKMPVGSSNPSDLVAITDRAEKERFLQKLKESV